MNITVVTVTITMTVMVIVLTLLPLMSLYSNHSITNFDGYKHMICRLVGSRVLNHLIRAWLLLPNSSFHNYTYTAEGLDH